MKTALPGEDEGPGLVPDYARPRWRLDRVLWGVCSLMAGSGIGLLSPAPNDRVQGMIYGVGAGLVLLGLYLLLTRRAGDGRPR
jgi:hypothetical protein